MSCADHSLPVQSLHVWDVLNLSLPSLCDLLTCVLQIIRDRATEQTRGFGFVTYAHPQSARMAMEHMNGATLMGPFENRVIKVSPSNKN